MNKQDIKIQSLSEESQKGKINSVQSIGNYEEEETIIVNNNSYLDNYFVFTFEKVNDTKWKGIMIINTSFLIDIKGCIGKNINNACWNNLISTYFSSSEYQGYTKQELKSEIEGMVNYPLKNLTNGWRFSNFTFNLNSGTAGFDVDFPEGFKQNETAKLGFNSTFVQSKGGKSFSGTSISVTTDSNVAVDSVIAVYTSWHGNVSITAIVSDTGTSTLSSWTEVNNSILTTVGRASMHYAVVTGAGSLTVTTTFSSTANAKSLLVHEINGTDTSSPLDGNALNPQINPGTGTDAVTSTAITTTSNGDYIFGAMDNFRQNAASTVGTGFTGRISVNGAMSEDQIQTSAGSIAATFTAVHAADDFITGIMAFKSAGGDTTSPQWSSRSVNNTNPQILDQVLFSAQWTDNTALSSYIYSWNASGVSCNTWANDSVVTFIGTQNWSNVSKQIPTTCVLGDLDNIAWYVWANDTTNNINSTPATFSFIDAPTQCWTGSSTAGNMLSIPAGCLYHT